MNVPIKIIQSITIPSGGEAYIPITANILAIDGEGTATSECIDLSAPPLACVTVITYIDDHGDNDVDSHCGVRMINVSINNVNYTTDLILITDDCTTIDVTEHIDIFNGYNIPGVKLTNVEIIDLNSRVKMVYTLKMPENYINTTLFEFKSKWEDSNWYVKPNLITCE